jgi:hypothetical protein
VDEPLPGRASGALGDARYDRIMRIAPSLLALCIASQAHADSGSGVSFDFGYVRNRVAVTDRTALPGELARFGIKVSLRRHFHFGAEAEEGRLRGTSNLPSGAVARTGSGFGDEPTGPLEGNTLALKAVAGVHSTVGRFTFGADLAGGLRDSWVSSDAGNDVAGRKNEPLLELRSRADVWLTSSTTLGAVLSSDVIEHRDVAVAAVFALHFTK